MGYGMHFPAHQVGGQPELWDIRGYGFSGLWVMTGPTVPENHCVPNFETIHDDYQVILITPMELYESTFRDDWKSHRLSRRCEPNPLSRCGMYSHGTLKRVCVLCISTELLTSIFQPSLKVVATGPTL